MTVEISVVSEIPTITLYIPKLLGWFEYQFPFVLG